MLVIRVPFPPVFQTEISFLCLFSLQCWSTKENSMCKAVLQLRIRINFCGLEPDPNTGCKNNQKIENVKKFHILKCWKVLFEG